MVQLTRRLTAAVLLAAILSMAAPAVAAAPPRPHSAAPAPTIQGTGLLHQVLTWLGSLWKTLPVSGSTDPDPDADRPRPVDLYRGGMIDPNG